MYQVFLCETIHPAARRRLAAQARIIDDLSQAKAVEGLISRNLSLTAEILGQMPRLRVIGVHGSGIDGVDTAAAEQRGVHVFSVPGRNADAVAELVVALALNLARRLNEVQRLLDSGTPYTNTLPEFAGHELGGKVFGMIGVGEVARRAARIFTQGFGMRAIGWSRSLTQQRAAELGIGYRATLEEVLAEADIVSLGLALNAETRGVIGARELALMRPQAMLINTARGALLDEAALAEALAKGRLAGAACDVFVSEPPAADHPLLRLPNFIATPHIGANTEEALLKTGLAVVDGVLGFLERADGRR